MISKPTGNSLKLSPWTFSKLLARVKNNPYKWMGCLVIWCPVLPLSDHLWGPGQILPLISGESMSEMISGHLSESLWWPRTTTGGLTIAGLPLRLWVPGHSEKKISDSWLTVGAPRHALRARVARSIQGYWLQPQDILKNHSSALTRASWDQQ